MQTGRGAWLIIRVATCVFYSTMFSLLFLVCKEKGQEPWILGKSS
jgi:hypothetical protein